jgi:hypothetical protein
MLFKYWVEFDENGEIKSFYPNKPRNNKHCKEYLIKLIPINRSEKLEEKVEESMTQISKLQKGMKQVETELSKTIKELRRIKL